MTRLLLDQGLAPRAAQILRQHGFDAIHVMEMGMERADDIAILERAHGDGGVCVWTRRDRRT